MEHTMSDLELIGLYMADETDALQAFLDGKDVKTQHPGIIRAMDGKVVVLNRVHLKVSRVIHLRNTETKFIVRNCFFDADPELPTMFHADQWHDAEFINVRFRGFERGFTANLKNVLRAATRQEHGR
jgi:hypothetical protein